MITRSTETIVSIKYQAGRLLGKTNSYYTYYKPKDRFTPEFEIYILNEKLRQRVIINEVEFKSPIKNSNWSTGFLRLKNEINNTWMYTVGYMNDDYKIYYQNLFLQYEGKDYFLDSIYNADKKIHSSFSADGRYLLVNTLNTLSDYYNPEQDNRIMVYDLSEIEKGKVGKQYIPCTHCSDSYLIGDQLFFTIGRKDGYDGFSNKDIYVAPWGSLKDSVKIARNTDIKAISPDGQSLLGIRFWDRQQNTAVVVDVKQRKYQMLLGRDYAKRKAFYSYHEKKFAFDFKGYLIYVALPESYPFDALEWRNEEIPDWTNKEFWKQFEHSPLSED
ncbi:MAG: hypothetical protein AAGI25_19510 [Bacteroidota bacterium]